MFRQGDVLVHPVDRIPEGLKKVPLDKGRVILAYGERTGHAHVVVGDVEFLAADLEELDKRFLRVEQEACRTIDAWRCRNQQGGICWVPATESAKRIEGITPPLAIIGREKVTGVVVEHDEHLPFVVTPGLHEVVRQREYQPEAPQWVAD